MSRKTAKVKAIPGSGEVCEVWNSDTGTQYYLTADVNKLAARNEEGKWARIPAFSGKKISAIIFARSKDHADAMLERIEEAQEIVMADLHSAGPKGRKGKKRLVVSGTAVA